MEITDVNKVYLERGSLRVEQLSRGYAWFDTGTFNSLVDANTFVQTIENRQGLRISVPEEIAFLNEWITQEQLLELAAPLEKSGYGAYLRRVAETAPIS